MLLATALGPVHQEYLLQARQMQALSFAVHIPLVCFGISFPALVVFVETLWLRTGDPLYRTLAMRWSRYASPAASRARKVHAAAARSTCGRIIAPYFPAVQAPCE